MTRTLSRLLLVAGVMMVTGACSGVEQTGSPSTSAGTSTNLASTTTSQTTSSALAPPAGLLLIRDHPPAVARPVRVVTPAGEPISDLSDQFSAPRWSGEGEFVVGYSVVDGSTALGWLDVVEGSVAPIDELVGHDDLLAVTIDGLDFRTDRSRYLVVTDESEDAFVVDLEAGAVTRLSGPILLNEARSLGSDALLARGPDLGLRQVDLTTGAVEAFGPETAAVRAVSPTGQAFIYYDLSLQVFRERAGDGSEDVIAPPARDAFYRRDGDVVVVTDRRVLVRTAAGDEALYETEYDRLVPLSTSQAGLVAVEQGADAPDRVLWIDTAGGEAVELDHPGIGGQSLAIVDDRWVLLAEDDFGQISTVDLRTGVRARLGTVGADRRFVGLTPSMGPWLELRLFSGQDEVWLVDRETAELVVIAGALGVFPSSDGAWIAYSRRVDAERTVHIAPIEDPADAATVGSGTLLGWLPNPDRP